MAQERKSGTVSSAVLAVAVFLVLLVMAVLEAPPSSFVLVLTLTLGTVLWKIRSARTALQEQIDELSAQLADSKAGVDQRIKDLQSQLRDLKAPVQVQSEIAVDIKAQAAHAASSSPEMVAAQAMPAPPIAQTPQFESSLTSAAPPPPPPPLEHPVPTDFLFAQIGETVTEPSFDVWKRVRGLNEELLGTNWLAKIGAAILVLGIAFFLAWQLRQVGPAGKVVVGWLVGGAMLGAGIFFERKERYRIVARAGVAAGWALCFCTAYAMGHIAAARVLDSTALDMVLMFVVAAAMIAHTLRYRSQVVTGLAFLLAFGAITVNRVPDVYSLTAAVVLAAGVAIVALRMRWFEMEVCAIALTFFNHWLWLRPIIGPMGGHHRSFPEFLPSAAILISYWAIFRISYLWREQGDHERLSGGGALLNTSLLLLVLKYQSVHPEWAFWALLALGTVELGLGQLRKARSRSLPHIVLTVTGACLLLTAIPFRFGPEYVSLLWLAEAQAFFLVGVFASEAVFRRVGLFAFVPLAVQLISYEFARVYGARMDGADVKGEFVPAFIIGLCALVLYANAHFVARRWAGQFGEMIERLSMRDLSYAAGILALAAGWMAFYFSGTAVFWMALTCASAWVAQKFDVQELRIQSLLLAAISFCRVLTVNLPTAGSAEFFGPHSGVRWSARLVSTVAVAALCYLAAVWHRRTDQPLLRRLQPGVAWLASTMLTLLMWYELTTTGVGLGWGIFALIMLEMGVMRRSLSLRLQAYVAASAVFLRIIFVNLNATVTRGMEPRLYTVVPLVVLFFYFFNRLESQPELSDLERRFRPALVFAWLGTLTTVLLLRFELPLDWVATGWALVVFALMTLAWKTQKRVFLHQAMLVSVGAVIRGVFHNLYERSYFTSPSHLHSSLTVLSAAGVLIASLFFAFRLRREAPEDSRWAVQALRMIDARPEQVLFFLPLALITAFLALELRSGMVTVAWGLEAVVVFVAALWIGERTYRLAGLGLLLLCVGKILTIDIWRLGIRDRAITFIVLGTLLLGVSILYSKHREKVRAYL